MDLTVAGLGIAFAAAVVATFLDCYFTLAKSLPRVPGLILVHKGILALAAAMGICAAAAFWFTSGSGDDAISTILTLKQTNPLLRGLAVGTMVLFLIRSKLFNFRDSGAGGEAFYTLLRALALESVNDTRTQQRNRFLNANIGAAFAIPTYFSQLEDIITAAMRVRTEELRRRCLDEVKAVKASLPAPPPAQSNPEWSSYYNSLTGVCFDYCGPGVLKGLPGFTGT